MLVMVVVETQRPAIIAAIIPEIAQKTWLK